MRWPYGSVLRHPVLRRLLPGLVVSALGDGMSVVAITWLALHLAPPGRAGIWVAVCSGAAVLPGVAGTLFVRRLGRLSPVTLGLADALLRGAGLAAVPVAALLGVLDVAVLAGLLAVSSVLRPWGSAAVSTVLARALPEPDRFAGNALVSALLDVGILVGPAVAALVIATAGPVASIAVDAATFLVLALAYLAARRLLTDAAPDRDAPAPRAGDVLRRPLVAALVALTLGFYALYGPVDVALPVHLATEVHAPAGLFAAYVTVFSVGAILGGLAAGWLSELPLWPLTCGIIVGWGLCLLPLALGAPRALSLIAFGLGAFVYAPYLAANTTLIQQVTPAASLAHVLAVRNAALNLAVPLGAVAAGPFIAGFGGRRVILASAVATIALGVAAGLAGPVGGRPASRSSLRERHRRRANLISAPVEYRGTTSGWRNWQTR